MISSHCQDCKHYTFDRTSFGEHEVGNAGEIIGKKLTSLNPGEGYAISIKVKRTDINPGAPKVYLLVDDVTQGQALEINERGWQILRFPFTATRSTHTIQLMNSPHNGTNKEPQDLFRYDEVRVYPLVFKEDFSNHELKDLKPGESFSGRYMDISNSKDSKHQAGVAKHGSDVPFYMSGNSLILYRNLGSNLKDNELNDEKREDILVQIDLHGDYNTVRFNWVFLHHDATLMFYNALGQLVDKTDIQANPATDNVQQHISKRCKDYFSRVVIKGNDYSCMDDFVFLWT